MKINNEKIKSLSELKKIVEKLKRDGKKIVWTNGCFDLFHIDHLRFLQEAKSFGDILVVGINSDSSIKKIKGDKRPIIPESERAEIISALECVDYVIIFSETTPNRMIGVLKPDVHVKGTGWFEKELPEEKLVKSYGGAVIITKNRPLTTTKLINRILRRYKCR